MTDYTVVRSPRARHVWLRFDREGRLTVTIPRRFAARRVSAIVEQHSEWIERTRSRVEARHRKLQAEPPPSLPESVALPAIAREWQVEYRQTPSPRLTVSAKEGALVLSGPVDDPSRCREALVRWLRRMAHAHLSELAGEVASVNGLKAGKVVVRAQRTRWASCSRRGTLSLNVRLLFISPELVRHVVVHELCHTKHMDHSPKFWECVARYDPDWREHRRRLRAAWHGVPRWLDCEVVALGAE
jgi:predicted metal-dependent hydrolase